MVSLADVIVLGGCAAIEQAAKNAGLDMTGALHARAHGRDAGANRRGFLRCAGTKPRTGSATISKPNTRVSAEELLVDRAQLLTLTAT